MNIHTPQNSSCQPARGPRVAWALLALTAAALAGCAQGSGSSMGGPPQDPSATSESRSQARPPRPADLANPRMGPDNAAGEGGANP